MKHVSYGGSSQMMRAMDQQKIGEMALSLLIFEIMMVFSHGNRPQKRQL